MNGVAGRSGPPGHTHSRGNRGGKGGPLGNTKNERHGLHSYLALGRLPKGAGYIRKLLGKLRAAIEDAVADRHGRIELYHAATIQSAVRHEGRALLLTRYLRQPEAEAMKISERAAILEAIGRATDSRDKCLRLLGLDQSSRTDVITALYAAPAVEQQDEQSDEQQQQESTEEATRESA